MLNNLLYVFFVYNNRKAGAQSEIRTHENNGFADRGLRPLDHLGIKTEVINYCLYCSTVELSPGDDFV